MFTDASMHSAQFMGLINAMRTGDPTVDMVGAMILPFLVQKAVTDLPRSLKTWLLRKEKKIRKTYTRTIAYKSTQNACGTSMNYNDDSYNLYLIRAMKLYVDKHCDLQLDEGEIDLVAMDGSNPATYSNNGRRCQSSNGVSTAEMLESTTMVERPMVNQWHPVGLYHGSKVELLMKDTENGGDGGNNAAEGSGGGGGGGNKQSSVRSLEIVLRSEGGVEPINKFVKLTHEWYVAQLKKTDEVERYMFDVVDSCRSGYGSPQYKAYALSEEKTFETLFSKQCHELLGVVDQFENRSGKYAIKGYPHKLGLLLSGPPGTGKTSLIKAMAHHCGRHIVSINLSRVTSNEQLMAIFFNKTYCIGGMNPQNLLLDYKDVIFVLEDVDASSDIVKDRKLLNKKRTQKKSKAQVVQSGRNKPKDCEDDDDDDEDNEEEDEFGNGFKKSTSLFQGSDDLNLSGILNVLDGVVDTPHRMVIMTSNHPEMLDPALIRPGRIDKILELGYMIDEDIIGMIQHYFQEKMSALQKVRVQDMIKAGIKVTPAQIEQMAVDVDSIDVFLNNLSRMRM